MQPAFHGPAGQPQRGHRPLGRGHNPRAILSIPHEWVVANDYTVRLQNRVYQVGKPVDPGPRRGRVVLESRREGRRAIRFGDKYLKYHEGVARGGPGGALPPDPPKFTAFTADA